MRSHPLAVLPSLVEALKSGTDDEKLDGLGQLAQIMDTSYGEDAEALCEFLRVAGCVARTPVPASDIPPDARETLASIASLVDGAFSASVGTLPLGTHGARALPPVHTPAAPQPHVPERAVHVAEARAETPPQTPPRGHLGTDRHVAPLTPLALTPQRKAMAELSTSAVKYLVWSPDMAHVALLSKHAVTICTRKLDQVCAGRVVTPPRPRRPHGRVVSSGDFTCHLSLAPAISPATCL